MAQSPSPSFSSPTSMHSGLNARSRNGASPLPPPSDVPSRPPACTIPKPTSKGLGIHHGSLPQSLVALQQLGLCRQALAICQRSSLKASLVSNLWIALWPGLLHCQPRSSINDMPPKQPLQSAPPLHRLMAQPSTHMLQALPRYQQVTPSCVW